MNRHGLTRLGGIFAVYAWCVATMAAPPVEKMELPTIQMGNEVLAANPPRFGTNIDFGATPATGGWTMTNDWLPGASFEPARFRHFQFATGGGKDFVEVKDGRAATFYSAFTDGWFDGASIRIYRQDAAGKVSFLRAAKVKHLDVGNSPRSANRIFLDKGGIEIKADDLYVLDLVTTNLKPVPSGAHVIPAGFQAEVAGGRAEDLKSVRITYDDTTMCPEGGSRASLKVGLVDAVTGGIRRDFSGAETNGATFLPPGAPMKLSLWLKQEGLGDGQVTVTCTDEWKETFAVGPQWKKHEFALTAKTATKLANFSITAKGPGIVWIDNVQLIDTSRPAYTVDPRHVAALKAFHPGAIRFWSGLAAGNTGGQSLESWLAPPTAAYERFDFTSGRKPPLGPNLQTCLNLALETGGYPWLTISPAFSDEEFGHLMEYLAGPAFTPYGKLRTQHGQPKPWTDVFERIVIEIGNENWNDQRGPLAFPNKPKFYAGYADLMFRSMKVSPYFRKDKFHFVLGGAGAVMNYRHKSWNLPLLETTTEADTLAINCYTAGYDGFNMLGTDDAALFLNRLNFGPRFLFGHLNSFDQVIGTKLKGAIYEAGPGYPAGALAKDPDANEELVNKSMGTAISVLDEFLYATAKGYTEQCYFLFRAGPRWASHSAEYGFRPQPAWLALQMRNAYCSGNLMSVVPLRIPKQDVPQYVTRRPRAGVTQAQMDAKAEELKKAGYTGVQIAAALESLKYRLDVHAGLGQVATLSPSCFKDGRKISFLVVSRDLTESRKVLIEMPGDVESEGHIARLESPKAWSTNTEKMEVAIREETVSNMNRRFTLEVKPHSVTVLQATLK